jgi:hypothetical protein
MGVGRPATGETMMTSDKARPVDRTTATGRPCLRLVPALTRPIPWDIIAEQ